MNDLKIIQIKEPTNKFLPQVELQFANLYIFMKDKGLKLPLIENGEKKWINSIKKTISKFSALIIAVDGEKVAGFVFGVIKFTPDYLGNQKVGFLTHQYTEAEYRRKGLGKKLLLALENWFKEKNVVSIEVQSSFSNEDSRKFFEKNAYKNELVQLRKYL